MTLFEKTRAELVRRFEAANWKEITITMKCGDILTLTPCGYMLDCTNENDCEYVIVEGSCLPWLGGNLDELTNNLIRYNDLLKEQQNDIRKLDAWQVSLESGLDRNGRPMTRENWEQEYEGFSDWSKDVYGYRVRIARPANLV